MSGAGVNVHPTINHICLKHPASSSYFNEDSAWRSKPSSPTMLPQSCANAWEISFRPQALSSEQCSKPEKCRSHNGWDRWDKDSPMAVTVIFPKYNPLPDTYSGTSVVPMVLTPAVQRLSWNEMCPCFPKPEARVQIHVALFDGVMIDDDCRWWVFW